MISFRKRLARPSPILLDGATGTELDRRGVDMPAPLWSTAALLHMPEIVQQVHADYVAAGAEVVTANTFRTHARSLVAAGLADRAAVLTQRAVAIARAAADGHAWVAGSQAPLEDCYSPELVPDDDTLRREHTQMAHNLAAAAVDLILVETHNTIREAVAATQAATATGLPTLVSFVCRADGRLLSGETIAAAAQAVLRFNPDGLLINCGPAPTLHAPLAALHATAPKVAFGAYGNTSIQNSDASWTDTDATDPATYTRYTQQWVALGATFIGGCCGTTPAHIRHLKDTLHPKGALQ